MILTEMTMVKRTFMLFLMYEKNILPDNPQTDLFDVVHDSRPAPRFVSANKRNRRPL